MKLVVCAAVLVLALGACSPRGRPGIPPRHLVLVTVEGLRADPLGPYLSDRPTTSLAADETARGEGRAMGLDDLAAAGVVFARCHAPGPHTVPSLASLFTGLAPVECGVTDDDEGVPGDVATLPQLFAHAGFQTAAFVTAESLDLEGALSGGFATFRTSGDDATTLTAAVEWARHDQGDGSRRFLWIHLKGPQVLWDGATGKSMPGVDELLAQRSFGVEAAAADVARFVSGSAAPDETQRMGLRASYDREVARTALGLSIALREAFDYYEANADASETWARTVFAFTSPCGSELGEDGLVGHEGTLHEVVLRVPLVVRHPDSLTGERVIGDVVELADLLPTFVEWFELERPGRVTGRSLLGRLDTGRSVPFVKRPAITALQQHVFSVRDERFHFVWNPLREMVEERSPRAGMIPVVGLYEPDRDPFEREDVSGSFPEVVKRFEEDVRVWRDALQAYPPEKKRAVGALR